MGHLFFDAAMPPVEVTPAAIKATLAIQAGAKLRIRVEGASRISLAIPGCAQMRLENAPCSGDRFRRLHGDRFAAAAFADLTSTKITCTSPASSSQA
jgi:hypothetical protein